jgi:hypothetical protein
MAVPLLACPSRGGLMELLNAMHARPVASPSGSVDVVVLQDDVPLQGSAPFQPTTLVDAGAPVEPIHDPVEAPQHVDSYEGFSTPKKVNIGE